MANNPTLLKMPLAADGEKTTIPETTGSTTGDFSQQYGFQQINALPLQAGGIAPKREDFNGAFNLLGGVAFYAQKGWVFEYDSTQDYYKGCIVTDPADGNKYECIADMAAGTVAPHSDSSNTYWKDANFLIKQITPAYNKRDEINTSGTYTAPVTGWYKITLKGGGGGGQGAYLNSSSSPYFFRGGAGGGEGGLTVAYKYMTAGENATVIIGAGGNGSASVESPDNAVAGGDGGDTTVVINSDTYLATGGQGGNVHGGEGGTGTIDGAPGGNRTTYSNDMFTYTESYYGGIGGGNGGKSQLATSIAGAGGRGGAINSTTSTFFPGGTGGDGYVWFEYWAE